MDTQRLLSARYTRQLILPEVGTAGQKKLENARILVVGAGGLGCPILLYLTAARIGTIGIVDNDVVDITNLQRQTLHCEKDLGRNKVISAAEKLTEFNSNIKFETYAAEFNLELARKLIADYDVVIAAVDNIITRKIINKVCFELNKPWIEGGVNGFNGIVTTFKPSKGPCYNCLYPDNLASDVKIVGLLGVLPGVIGSIQAQEALKLVLGIGENLIGKLLIYNSLELTFNIVDLMPNHECSICNKKILPANSASKV